MKVFTVAFAAALIALATPAKANDLALAPVGASVALVATEIITEGALTTALGVGAAVPLFMYATFETNYKPFEAAFGADHVFYEYPPMLKK